MIGILRGHPVRIATVLIILAMAVIPALVPRTEGRQDAFAWEMFTEAAPIQVYDVETASGRHEYQPQDVLAVVRADVDYSAVLPGYLCETVPDALVVTVREGGTAVARRACP